MSIGLYDMDMATYTLVPFNLELMKLSAYYKKKREVVILSPSLTPDRHQKFFLRKDYDDGNFPMGLEKVPNLDYGGYGEAQEFKPSSKTSPIIYLSGTKKEMSARL